MGILRHLLRARRGTALGARAVVGGEPARQDGQALVEFTLIIPILLTVVFAIIQFGLFFYNYIDLTSATRDGARKGAVSRYSTDPVGDAKKAVSDSTAVVDDSKNTVTVSTPGGWNAGESLTVTSSYPYTVTVMGITFWSKPLTAVAQVRIE